MLVVVFARRLAESGFGWLEPVGRLAWPWYVPLGTVLAVCTGVALSYLPSGERPAGQGKPDSRMSS
jgi:TRAP-type C4-dicarboxylate transport system permease small subunit